MHTCTEFILLFFLCLAVSCTCTVYSELLLSLSQHFLLGSACEGKCSKEKKQHTRKCWQLSVMTKIQFFPYHFLHLLCSVFCFSGFLSLQYSILASFIISLLCWPLQSVLGFFFFCPLAHCLSLVPILCSVTWDILVCGLDQCSSNCFKVFSLTVFHGNPRVPGVGRMSSAYALLRFFHHFTIPFECFHERNIWESLS